jgi:hypothetical protein
MPETDAAKEFSHKSILDSHFNWTKMIDLYTILHLLIQKYYNKLIIKKCVHS